uniref:Putative F-box protein, identical n=1 Tax=Solanum demissum TaxID=50514 RepID=Q6L3V8_SOLDE|nr:Putative F-box protein, identical [Solanum demissum]
MQQAIQIILLKFFSWYDFVFTPTCTTTDSKIPNEIITDILLRLPPKSLLKCMSVSKSWHQLISSPDFVNTHLKLNSIHRVLFPGINGNFNFSSLLPSTVQMGSIALISSAVDESDLSYVVNIYSLRTDSWKTLHDQLKGVFLINLPAKFVNGKLYWTASTSFCDINVCKIISFDIADETWGSLELPICREDNSNFKLGAVGNELSMIYTANLVATTSDVWILKNSGLHVSWTKQFTIEYPQNAGIHMVSLTTYPFSTHLRHSTKGDILLSLPGVILIFGGSTRKLEHTVDVVGCDPVEFYAGSIVNPL